MENKKIKLSGRRGQTLPTVLVMSMVMAIMGGALLVLLKQESKTMVIFSNTVKEQELASVALEHALYKLQAGSNWHAIPLEGFSYDKEYGTPNGNYTVGIIKGNLFLTNKNDPTTRQGQEDFRTIGIKIKVTQTAKTRAYYAVVKKGGYAGAIISKGIIDLPCTKDAINYKRVNIFWGDIYSANPAEGSCKIPAIKVGEGDVKPQYWLPEVYAKSNIFTAYRATGCDSTSCSTYYFAYEYKDMSPTAHSHPYSAYAQAPEVDLDFYKNQAKIMGSYYGPSTVGGNANPYYCGKSLTQVTQANVKRVFADNLKNNQSVLFIDSTDGLSVSGTNTYTGVTYVTSAAIKVWTDANNQYSTRGYMFVMGPLVLMGDNPDKPNAANYSDVTGVAFPDNYYFPQGSSGNYVYTSGNLTKSYIDEVKHAGLLYMGGELQIGGLSSGDSVVTIYGALYLDQFGALTMTESPDAAKLYIYFNHNQNMFGFMGSGVSILSFNELTFLVPTPLPVYPASF